MIAIFRFDYKLSHYMQASTNYSLNQDNVEKMFFDQIRSGDYIDARNSDNEWKLAKVIDRDNKHLAILYDGYPPSTDVSFLSLRNSISITCELKLCGQSHSPTLVPPKASIHQ